MRAELEVWDAAVDRYNSVPGSAEMEPFTAYTTGALFGVRAHLTLSDTRWKQEREAIARMTDPDNWETHDYITSHGEDPHLAWFWIKNTLRRADDVLRHLGYTREGTR